MDANRTCPICFEIPEQEIYQCAAGHIICSRCIVTLSICPQCRVAFEATKIRNRVLEEILDAEEFECPFKDGGCEYKCKRGDISKHAKSCDFNPGLVSLCEIIGYENCKYTLGSSSKSREEILAHFQTVHGCGMADYGDVKMLLDPEELNGDDAKLLRPVIISQQHETSDLFLLVGKINSPLGFISEICIQVWGNEEPVKPKYEATFSIVKRPSENNNGETYIGNSAVLKLDSLRLQWTLNVYTVEEAKYVLEATPINVPIPFLANCLTSRNTETILEVKIFPAVPSSNIAPTLNYYC
ncbi:E3 ubiquitin-protein ligase Siah1 [Orchesella cincta]|uniref:RING-type E3 ubiquitin transferase n=1 Tax=Orchesella cincta TaxID=48709 RepID=A0A1D2N0B3_ORCCI|nr:E3 ubiquitin-protein ligase Siah1 [Orchesella cincta]